MFGLRALRRREIEAFRDADMVDFHMFEQVRVKEEEKSDPVMARVEAFAAMNPDAVTLKRAEEDRSDAIVFSDAPDPSLYKLKERVFDETTANLLKQLNNIVPKSVLVLTHVPLSEFAVTDEASGELRLASARVPYLLVEASSMAVICGLQLKSTSSGVKGADIVKTVFGDLNLPLLEFPVTTDLSELEMRDKLDPILQARERRDCPKCGEAMSPRKAQKGKRAGQVFWVCVQFPNCRGVVQI